MQSPTFRDAFLERVTADRRDEARRQIDMARNFFKHADRDADRTLTLSPSIPEWELIDCLRLHVRLTDQRPALFDAFAEWWSVRNQQLLGPQYMLPIVQLQQALRISDNRADFLAGYMARRRAGGTT